jgi:hypothetical protein
MKENNRNFLVQRKSMQLSQIVSVAIFTFALTLTVYVWLDRFKKKEGFSDVSLDPATISAIKASINNNPTDDDAIKAHQTLLRYIKHDFGKGVKFVMDFGKRFFDKPTLREDLDVKTLMNNYSSPLQGS